MGFLGLRKRHNPIDAGSQFFLSCPIRDVAGGGSLFFSRGVEHRKAVERTIFGVKWTHRKWRPRIPASHDNHPPPHREKRDCSFKIGFAQSLPPDIDTFGCEFFDAGIHVFRFVVEGEVRAEFATRLDLFRSSGGRDDFRAEDFRDLNYTRTDCARAAVHEKDFSGLEFCVANQTEMGSNSDEGEGDDVFVFYACGSCMQPFLVHDTEFGESSGPSIDTLASDPNTIASFEAFNVWAGLDNGASEITTQNIGESKFGGNHSGANVNIDWIHIHGSNFDEAFGSTGFWRGQIAIFYDSGRTGLVDEGSFHKFP